MKTRSDARGGAIGEDGTTAVGTVQEELKQLADGGKTVLVDFTAKWCLTCKFLEHTVLNTKEVRQAVDDNGIVTLVADWTDRDPEMGKLLESLGSKQVPVIAIFPAGRPNQPIVLLGGYTQATLLDKLPEAGPSKAKQPPRDSRGLLRGQ